MARKTTAKKTTIAKVVKSQTAAQALLRLETLAVQHGLKPADSGDLIQRIGCSEFYGPNEEHLRGYELGDGASLSIHVWHNGDHVAAIIDVTAPAATMRTLLTIWAQREIPANVACDEVWLQRWVSEQEHASIRSRKATHMYMRGTVAREGKLEPNPYCDYGLSDIAAACAAIAWDSITDLENRAWEVAEEQDAGDDLLEMYWRATRNAEQQAVREIMAPVWDAYVAYKTARGGIDYINDMEDQTDWLEDLRIWYDRRAREETQQARHDWKMLDSCTIANAEHQRVPAQAITRAYSAHSNRLVDVTVTCERHADAEAAALDLARVMLQAMLPTRTQGTQGAQMQLC